jgi:hypothetical protein
MKRIRMMSLIRRLLEYIYNAYSTVPLAKSRQASKQVQYVPVDLLPGATQKCLKMSIKCEKTLTITTYGQREFLRNSDDVIG